LARLQVVRSAGEDLELRREPGQQGFGRQHAHARRRQLNGQRQPIQPRADGRDGRRVGRGHREVGPGVACPLDEQRHRSVLRQALGRHVLRVGQRDAAGRQHREARTGCQQTGDLAGHADDLLAVVQQQQQSLGM
jgi:hypothetical protein